MPAAAVKVVVVALAATVTDAGVVSSVLLSDTATVVAVVGALDRVTVQVLLAVEFRLVGVQASDVSVTGDTRLMVAVLDTPFNVAVTVAL